MKPTSKILLAIAICCLSFSSAYAQRYYEDRGSIRSYYDLSGTVASYFDIHLGEGIGRGAKGTGGINAAFLYRMSPVFQFGVGGGIDYVHALALQGKLNKKNEFDYHGELTLPVFMRGRYLLAEAGYTGGADFFIQFDLGYRFGISAYNTGKNKGVFNNLEKCNVKGLFIEPQFGIDINETLSVSLGLPFQHYNKHIYDIPVADITSEISPRDKSLMFAGVQFHFMVGF